MTDRDTITRTRARAPGAEGDPPSKAVHDRVLGPTLRGITEADHEVHERAWLVVAAGEIEVEQGGRTVTGGPGFLAHFEPAERHEVRATSDARLILLLSPWPGDGHPSRRD